MRISIRIIFPIVLVAIILIVFGVVIYAFTTREVDTDPTTRVQGDLRFLNQNSPRVSRDIYKTVENNFVKKKHKIVNSSPTEKTQEIEKKQVVPTQTAPEYMYKYVGYLERLGKSEAFVIKGEEMYVVKVGDALSSRYRVIEITNEKIKLQYEPQGQVFMLVMSGRAE